MVNGKVMAKKCLKQEQLTFHLTEIVLCFQLHVVLFVTNRASYQFQQSNTFFSVRGHCKSILLMDTIFFCRREDKSDKIPSFTSSFAASWKGANKTDLETFVKRIKIGLHNNRKCKLSQKRSTTFFYRWLELT